MSGSGSRTPVNSTGPHIFGAAKQMATTNNPRALKDLSMAEKLKLAEGQARLAGTTRRPTDYPWAKRIVVSDIAVRHKTMESTTVTDQVDSNEEFFGNLLMKMTEEQFMPDNNDLGSRKRTCVNWNKENLSLSGTGKRQKTSRKGGRFTIPEVAPFRGRLMLPQTDANPPFVAEMQVQGDKTVPRKKLTFNLIQKDINMRDLNSNTRCDSSLDATRSVNESISASPTADDSVLELRENIFKLQPRNSSSNNVDLSSDHDDADKKKYPSNLWTGPCLSTIEEYHEPSLTDISLTVDAIGMDYGADIRLTPPLQTELIDCGACRVNEENIDVIETDVLRSPDVNLFS